MAKSGELSRQIIRSNNLIRSESNKDSLLMWMEAYFQFEVTTLPSSQKEQRRDIQLIINYIIDETGKDSTDNWTPRTSAAFKQMLTSSLNEKGRRRWNDRTINRIIAHTKTFAKWIHSHRPFTLGNPMEKIKGISTAGLLSIERALTMTERRRILDAADLMLKVGGLSRDRNRFGREEDRPRRKDYRPYRNRAIVYTLIETGMRRAAVTHIRMSDIDFERRIIRTLEKGSNTHEYTISREGLMAINDYIENERHQDCDSSGDLSALFLPANSAPNNLGYLKPDAINIIWHQITKQAGVTGKTPHSARHAMGKYIIDKTGNIAAVQRQLGHKNAAYSLQYSRITSEELKKILDLRD